MKKFRCAVNYDGVIYYTVEAKTAEEAMEIAQSKFYDEPDQALIDNYRGSSVVYYWELR